MKLIKYILAVLFITTVAACSDLEKEKALENPAAPALASHENIIINANNLSETTTFRWQPADFGYPAVVQYSLLAQVGSGAPVFVSSTYNDSIALKLTELNNAVISAGATVGVENKVIFTVSATISEAYQKAVSLPVEVTVTPYEPQPAWIYAVGEFQGWNRTGGYSLISVHDDGIYIGYINFPGAASPFLILPNNEDDWNHKWGSDDGATLIEDGGADIKSPGAGYHKITANLTNLTIQMIPYSWGIIGSATPGGWDNDTGMSWDYEALVWKVTVDLKGGEEFKLRLNNDWDTNYGITDGAVVAGGNNIPVAEDGTYLVIFDEEKPAITWTKQ
ncbi:MAG: SusE domain-containing protein [Dysgonamonadaceae bacterium]|jgi:hypothetical protein|nr:SusE domain-containing protein [Dysgonamonadaceae bacterium]